MKNAWVNGAAFMSVGSLVGSTIAFVASIALARLYSPSEHGVLTAILALSAITAPVVSGRLETAIPIPEQDAEAFKLTKLGIIWAITSGTVLFCAASVVAINRTSDPGAGQVVDALWIVPIMSTLAAIIALLNQFSVRQQKYRLVGVRNAAFPSFTALSQVFFSIPLPGAWGLIAGACLGRASTLAIFTRDYIRNQRTLTNSPVSNSYAHLVKRFWRFSTAFASSAIINALGLQVPVLLIVYLYGEAAAGQFGISQRTLAVPIMLIGVAIGQVFISELGRAMRAQSKQAMVLFISGSKVLLAAGVFVGLVLLLLGPFIFKFVFGPEWRQAGEIARAMSISFCAQIVAGPLSQALIVYERRITQLVWDLSRLLAISAAVVVPSFLGLGLVATCWILSVTGGVMYAVSWLLSRQAIQNAHPKH